MCVSHWRVCGWYCVVVVVVVVAAAAAAVVTKTLQKKL